MRIYDSASRSRLSKARHALLPLVLLVAANSQADDETKTLSGRQAFAACAACHSLKAGEHKVGPSLRGVVGQSAASAEGFAYSPALQAAGLTWDRENLFAWIAGSESLVPGSWMLYDNVLRPEEVMALIDYLSQSGGPGSNEP